MSNNTNSLFWIITGAVVVLVIFFLVNSSNDNTINKIFDKFGNVFTNSSNQESTLKKYYGHEPNYKNLKITDESLFEFDVSSGTIIGYKGTNTNVVIPYKIKEVEVKNIDNLDLWNNYLYSQDCEFFLNSNDDDFWIKDHLMMLESLGIIKDGQCKKRVLIDTVVIPNTVEIIGSCAFCYNSNLKTVNLPDSIKIIDSQAFSDNMLTSIDLDYLKNLTYIGAYAFANNQITGEVVIPNSVTSMDYYAFGNNDIIKAIVSKNLSNLPMYTFYANPNMESVNFLNSRMSIRELINGNDYTFNQDSNFIINVPTGSKNWYNNFPALNKYKIVEVRYE